MANTSASGMVRGLMFCSPWMADSAPMRSRSRAAFSYSSVSAASPISTARRWRMERLLPDRNARASSTSTAYSSSAISRVHGAAQRLIWNCRQGRVRFS